MSDKSLSTEHRGQPPIWRALKERLFLLVCLGSTGFGLLALAALTYGLVSEGWSVLSWDFITAFPSRFADKAGIYAALVGTLWLMVITAFFTVPLGVGTAIYLEEFAAKSRITRLIQVNITNLAGVPSIVYGLLGLAIFVRTMHLGRSLLAGALTMSLLILPVVITSAQEALRAVPHTYREASLAVGATRWETVRNHVLPQALPGMLTGIILGLSRAIGETAPLITIGALGYVAGLPRGPLDSFTVMPIQIYNWASMPQKEFHADAAGAILVLMAVLILFNGTAIYMRQVARKRLGS
ncbi:MAG: phosphate ABC transporter permease PstA [Armatimonadetes bacterium]|nr:phosphate ABC transporter permease PstA [Armatimonadota bacterium]